MNEIPIILVGYQNLRIQDLAHKGLIGSLNVTYHAGKFLTWFLKKSITIR
jgi:hypothetical protein